MAGRMLKRLKVRLAGRYKTYYRGGYRWHEFQIGRRWFLTWQVPFWRHYSIAWSQEQIDKDVARAMMEVQNSLVGEAELRRRFLNEEVYDGG